MAQISAALVAEHSTSQGAGEDAAALLLQPPGTHHLEQRLYRLLRHHQSARGSMIANGHHIPKRRHLSNRAVVLNDSSRHITPDYVWKGMHMSVKTMDELLLDELKDLYSAEKQITKALPKMAKAAVSPDLKKAFETHLEETKGHIERLDKIFEVLGKSPKGKVCHGMEGLLEEGSEVLKEADRGGVRDAALISAAQRVEHYEMAGYGSVREYASLLGQKQIASLLDETLEEEKATDEKLTGIAKKINPQALRASKAA
jgi:ferritin-like metal-binding protein YciE